ncbi:hypothetical protein ACFQ0T_04235 [Kitasatospora gansuensis]
MRRLSVLGAAVAGFAAVLALVTPASAAGPSSWVTANSDSTGDQDSAQVAANRLGDVAVVWEDDRDSTNPGDNAHSDVWVRMYRNGVSAYEQKLSAGGTAGVAWRHLQPDVGLDDRGNAVVVWAEDPDGNGLYNITYRVLSPAGAVLGSGQANASRRPADPSARRGRSGRRAGQRHRGRVLRGVGGHPGHRGGDGEGSRVHGDHDEGVRGDGQRGRRRAPQPRRRDLRLG